MNGHGNDTYNMGDNNSSNNYNNLRSRQHYSGMNHNDDNYYDDNDDDHNGDYRSNEGRHVQGHTTTPFYLTSNQAPTSLRGDGYGGGGILKYSPLAPNKDNGIQSHNYEPDESEVWRAYVAQVHFSNRGHW